MQTKAVLAEIVVQLCLGKFRRLLVFEIEPADPLAEQGSFESQQPRANGDKRRPPLTKPLTNADRARCEAAAAAWPRAVLCTVARESRDIIDEAQSMAQAFTTPSPTLSPRFV